MRKNMIRQKVCKSEGWHQKMLHRLYLHRHHQQIPNSSDNSRSFCLYTAHEQIDKSKPPPFIECKI